MRNDLAMYDACAGQWWDPRSRFAASLHGMNELRLRHFADEFPAGLSGQAAVDLGCGGGLCCEPLARLGARVIGIDASAASIAAARAHGAGIAGLEYRLGDAREPGLAEASADLVCCSDVLEHIADWRKIVAVAARILRPGGRFYVSTINRTWLARILAVHVVEGLRLVPPGTHDPRMLITPGELVTVCGAHGLGAARLLGQRIRVWDTIRHWAVRVAPGPSLAMCYAAWFRRG